MRVVKQITSHLLSFEAVFLFFLMAGEFKLLPALVAINNTIDITALSMAVSMIAGCIVLSKRMVKEERAFFSISTSKLHYLLVVFVFFAYAVITYALHPPDPLATRKTVELVTIMVWCALAGAFIMNDRTRASRFVVLSVLFAVLLSGALATRIMSGDVQANGLAGGFGEGYHRVGRAAGAAILVCVISFLYCNSKLLRLSLLAIMLFCALAMILSGHRAPFVTLPVTIILLWALYAGQSDRKRLQYLSRHWIIAFTIVLCIFSTIIIVTVDRAGYLVDRFQKVELTIAENARLQMYQIGLEKFTEHPLFGVGLGRFNSESQLQYRHPHNIVIEILMELGLVGLLLFVIVYFRWGLTVRRGRMGRDVLAIVLVSQIWFYLLNAMISGDITDNRILFVFVVMLTSLARERRD